MVAQADQDIAAIRSLGEQYFQAANEGSAERCVQTMAPDVIVMPPNRPSIIGLDELYRRSSEYHSTYDVEYRLTYDEIHVAGDIAFARSSAEGRRKSRADGKIDEIAWRNVWIFRRQASGEWKFWRIMFNSPLLPVSA